jgi:glycyl-tRNA synthetase beta chain
LLLVEDIDAERFDLKRLLDLTAENYADRGFDIDAADRRDLEAFFEDRLFHYFEDRYPHELLVATIPGHWNQPVKALQRMEWLESWRKESRFQDVLTAHERPSNILDGEDVTGNVDPDAFVDETEDILHQALTSAEESLDDALETPASPDAVLSTLAGLRMPVDDFFDSVMVMAEDEAVRSNRLALLKRIKALFDRVADFSAFD